MEGRVTKYFSDLELGIIAADDGRKYRFRAAQVMNRHLPIANQDVDFLVASGHPTQIIVLDGTAWTAFGSIEPRQY